MSSTPPILSICVATFKRAAYIEETLRSLLHELPEDVEVVVVDGASPDDTESVVSSVMRDSPAIRYFREEENSGIDRDYDKAVRYAQGQYCWLMTDDDLLKPGAVAKVFALLDGSRDLIVVNAEVRNATLDCVLDERLLKFNGDRDYRQRDPGEFLSDVGNYLSFIGGIVIRRSIWMARSDGSHFGTLFAHMGVIFDHPPLRSAHVVAEPLIVIRYGNAMWTARSFEIWMFKFPELVWSFVDYPDSAKRKVTAQVPWKSIKKLVMFRATGGYSSSEYKTFLRDREGIAWRPVVWSVAHMPATLANLVAICYCMLVRGRTRALIYDIGRSQHATAISRLVAGRLLR